MQLVFKRITPSDKEYTAVFELREAVLRRPIGLSLHDEDLRGEVNDYILVAEESDELLACLILTPRQPGTLQLRQMAVQPGMQGRNIGRALVAYAEQYAWENGYDRIILHARTVAQGFYDKLGYLLCSDVFEEVGIPHVEMEKHRSELP